MYRLDPGRLEGEELHQNQDLIYLLERRRCEGGSTFFLIFVLFLYLSIITAYRTYSLAARYLFVCVANMFTSMILKIRTKSFLNQ